MTDRELAGCALLPCPFCGEPPRMFVGYRADYDVKILCPRCGSEGDLYGADDFKGDDRQVWIETAIAAWNRRTPSSEGDGRDAERYRWLRHATLLSSPTPVITKGVYLDGRHIGNESLWGANADAAIDAAIAAAARSQGTDQPE